MQRTSGDDPTPIPIKFHCLHPSQCKLFEGLHLVRTISVAVYNSIPYSHGFIQHLESERHFQVPNLMKTDLYISIYEPKLQQIFTSTTFPNTHQAVSFPLFGV